MTWFNKNSWKYRKKPKKGESKDYASFMKEAMKGMRGGKTKGEDTPEEVAPADEDGGSADVQDTGPKLRSGDEHEETF
jgi:hypothetical protein